MNNFPQRKNIKDIILLFSKIDEKILCLKNSSSKDFDLLYKLTKEIFCNVEKLNKNSSTLFNQFNDEINVNFYENINNIKNDLSKFIFERKTHTSKNNSLYENLSTNIQILFVPLNNIKQNLLTLLFLTTQLKLKLSLNNSNTSINNEINELEILIHKTKNKYDFIIPEINNLKGIFSETNNIIKKSSHNLSYCEELLNFINLYISNVDGIKKKLQPDYSSLKKHSDNCSNSINILITNLQYQDIINQKIQHVQDTYKQIVEELNILKQLPDENSAPTKNLKYISQLALIAKIQANQLITTNKDYQNTINIINKNLLQINNNLYTVKTINLDFIYFYFNFKKIAFNNFQKKHKSNSSFLHSLLVSDSNIDSKFIEIKNSLIKINDSFKLFKSLNSGINNIITTIEKKLSLNETEKDDFLSLKEQINSTYQDINKYNLKTENVLNNSISDFNNIKSLTNSSFNYKFEENISAIIKNFNQMNSVNENFLKIGNQNSRIINGLLSNIENITKKINYYNFFEETISDINNDLNSIIQLSELNNQNKMTDCEEIRYFNNYSTKTERDVHDNVISKPNSIMDNQENNENDVELF
ncbi:MAG: hypothetical protein IMY72_10605 [Bacteroidetes bacterium]|nr:hypothetical protein [Bacteroidota bacterium]